jgi:hypothetical protein
MTVVIYQGGLQGADCAISRPVMMYTGLNNICVSILQFNLVNDRQAFSSN